ncbi:MAG: aconitate hydratase AcnA [Acidimicrobiia bacterium]|nr:aconitate hydratase AcnA [Acidimicrobiia bacterium]MDH4306637.1 aconitate hydratase AcnA [Acidimicrobiia bacterium]
MALQDSITTPLGSRRIARLSEAGDVDRLPYTIKVLLEAALRTRDDKAVTDADVATIAAYDATRVGETEIPFIPGRVVLQDFTGVPAVVDLAAMRAAIVRMTGNPDDADKVNPGVPCDLVVDHSVQVDAFGRPDALVINSAREFERNEERYEFLKWGQSAFRNFRVVPPATGIVHQVNLEYLAKVVWDDRTWLYPDSLVGTDSHTTMINGLGVVGWGVGGIEAEAAMLGQPISMLLPEVIGFKLTGRLAEGATATDLVLRVTEMLRTHGVVGKFVEFFGPGLADMPIANRATIANMAPEYGATVGYFPVDERTLDYMRLTGRSDKLIEATEWYYREQGMWRDDARQIAYTAEIELDMGTVQPALAGPKRPQDRIDLTAMKDTWTGQLGSVFGREHGAIRTDPVSYEGNDFNLTDGDVVIAAITSCTNTSNPDVMVGAGLVARKARELGITRKPWVKTSLAPGSQVVTEYLRSADLLDDLAAAGFYLVGYGCTTCIGNSGPLPTEISNAITVSGLVATSVLSGNRNFEGRISPDVRANYLASPPLVVAYALAGTVNWDPATEPFPGTDVYLRDVWPTQAEVDEVVSQHVTRDQFIDKYGDVFAGSEEWQSISMTGGGLYSWNDASTYVQEPPFFVGLSSEVNPISAITGARALAKLGDSVTTDHISPAGSIKVDSPAGQYLIAHGVQPAMFNSYGSRRGNDRVMTRGTFANIRVRNHLAPGTEGGFTMDFLDGEVKAIYDASMNYQQNGVPLVVLAGKDYGMGSSRDWAAKGTFLLGVKAVLAESFERIHRSNLVMMGVLPLEYRDGDTAESLGLDGTEVFEIDVDDTLVPRQPVLVRATKDTGAVIEIKALARVDTPVEVEYLRNGGILHYVLRQMAATA